MVEATRSGIRRTALVTGAAGGIGGAILRSLIDAGCAVIGVDQVVPGGSENGVSWHVCDLADSRSIEQLTETLAEERRHVDILVNCAGINRQKPNGEKYALEEVDNDGWALTLAINLTAPFLLARAFVPAMKRQRWGRIINISSRAGRTFVAASNADYSASKAGLVGLTRLIAGECAPFGVTANCVAPGRVSTPLADIQSAEIINASVQAIPAGRIGAASEIGATVAFLASEEAGYVTGVTIDVNGGAFMQ